MNKNTHRIYISTLVAINLIVFFYLTYKGFSYYTTPVVDRYFHTDHSNLKPSGPFGHGYGIVGSILIIIGVFGYIARKKYRSLASLGRLKYWLEFHIFLCSLGPILILFHTAFKFGGIVSISFWSMVLVVLSGIIGRYIYIQIPRTIEGRELSLNEAKEMKKNISNVLRNSYHIDEETIGILSESTNSKATYQNQNRLTRWFQKYQDDKKTIKIAKKYLQESKLSKMERKQILNLVKDEISLNNKIDRLLVMQSLFKHWHVIHLPFALIMLIIMIIHVVVTITFGYKWIF